MGFCRRNVRVPPFFFFSASQLHPLSFHNRSTGVKIFFLLLAERVWPAVE